MCLFPFVFLHPLFPFLALFIGLPTEIALAHDYFTNICSSLPPFHESVVNVCKNVGVDSRTVLADSRAVYHVIESGHGENHLVTPKLCSDAHARMKESFGRVWTTFEKHPQAQGVMQRSLQLLARSAEDNVGKERLTVSEKFMAHKHMPGSWYVEADQQFFIYDYPCLHNGTALGIIVESIEVMAEAIDKFGDLRLAEELPSIASFPGQY